MNTLDPTSLDGLETSHHPSTQPTPLQRRFFQGALPTWQHLIRTLAASDDPSLIKRSAKMSDCCRFPVIKADEHGHAIPSLGRCKDRLCPLCSRTRGFQAAERAEKFIRAMNAPRFLTLTLKHTRDSLTSQVDRLMAAFRTLRKTDLVKERMTGGIYTLELTRSRPKGQWHPHLHIIFDGKFLPHSSLRDEWHRITGDSSIVDIRTVRDRKVAAHYIAEYISKCPTIKQWQPENVWEYASALHGRRLINTFGCLHGKKIDAKPEKTLYDHTRFFPPPSAVVRAYAEQNIKAIHAVHLANRLGGVWCRLFGVERTVKGHLSQTETDETLKQLADVLEALYNEIFPYSRQANRPPPYVKPDPPPQPAQLVLTTDDLPF